MVRSGGIAIAALLAALGCAVPQAPDSWKLWTIDALARPAITPAGEKLALLSSPYPLVGSQTGAQQPSQKGLTIFPAFSEGQTAAYMTTEIWQNFDRVWVQPLYFDVTKQNPPIFSVDTSSRFYSPYWQIFTYSLPPGSSFRSAKEVIDSGVTLTPNSAKFCSITRDSSILAATQLGDSGPLRPLTGEPVGAPVNGKAHVDGHQVSFIDLGNAQRFTFDPLSMVVDETPLFAFALPDSNGKPLEVDLPKVGGTGELHHPRCDGHGICSGVSNNVPEFGSLWRIYHVLLPPGADVYVPNTNRDLQIAVRAMGFAAPEGPALPPEFILRVALNGKSCLVGDPSKCQWLDSQNAIESSVPDWRITKTARLVTCPLILFNGHAIGAPKP
jgi:hypothetical protein